MAASTYTAVVSAPATNYASGAMFIGRVTHSPSTSTITYTLGQSFPSSSYGASITLTATFDAVFGSNPPGDITFTLGNSSNISSQTSSIILGRSIPADNAGFSATSSSSATTTEPSSTTATSTTATSTTASSTISTMTSARVSSATVPPSSTSAGTGSPSASSSEHSTGEVVGVAIGAVVAGALIAALVVFFIMRKRSKKHSKGYNSGKEQSSLSPVGEAVVVDGKDWQRHLPQPESDHTISRATIELFDQIELHVEHFYADRIVEMQNVVTDRPSQLLTEAVSSGLRPILAIKYIMATIVLSSIDFEEESEYSLLPANFFSGNVHSNHKKPGINQAVSQWRVLTAYLEADTLKSETYRDEHKKRVAKVTNELCRTFQPWLQGDDQGCRQSTNGILSRGNNLGILMFSHPASFVWDWGREQAKGSKRRTILPGLIKTSDELAQPLTEPVYLAKRRTCT